MLKATFVFLVLLAIASCSLFSISRVFKEHDVSIVIPEQYELIGKSLGNEKLELTIAIKQRNFDRLEEILLDISNPQSKNYGNYLTLDEIHRLMAPKQNTVSLIREWLHKYGIVGKLTSPGFMKVITTVEKVEELLHVEFSNFRHKEKNVVISRSLEYYSVPKNVGKFVDFITGVTNFPRTFQKFEYENDFSVDQYVTPESIQQLYNIKIPPFNSKNIQAVASFLQQYYDPKDLESFQSKFSLGNCTIDKTFGENDVNEPGVECSLDVQYLQGVNNCTITTYDYSTPGQVGENEPWLDFLQTLDSQTSNFPYLISMSYQDYEYTVSLDYADRCNQEFAKNSARGITFITGSGDWGVGCKFATGCNTFNADFPSSSPYVVSTGATILIDGEEQGVDFSSGGFSNYFGQPSYQSQAVNAYLAQSNKPSENYFNVSGRGFPDVAAIGTYYQVFVNGRQQDVAGTSASTPCFGSILSMINTLRLNANKPTLGWVQPFLYQADQQNSNAYTDITKCQVQAHQCCNQYFECVSGWDPQTGLGTPNYDVLSSLAMSSSMFPSFS